MNDTPEIPDSPPAPRPRIRYAAAGNKHIAAAINGLYRFRTAGHAEAKLASIKNQFTTVSLEEGEVADASSITLWLRDFDLSPAEEEAGYLGHYATIRVEQMKDEDEYYTLTATRVERPLKNHPLRKRPPARCPNWGHPILRGVLKGKQHTTLESAIAEFEQLQLEYPETTVPGQNKLYLMVFSRRENPTKPIEKYVLEIKNVQGGGFIIESSKNTYKPKAPSAKTAPELPQAEEAPAPMGHFSSMVALKRNKKKPKT